LLVDAQRSPDPGCRFIPSTWNSPILIQSSFKKNLIETFVSASRFTVCDPGTTIARTEVLTMSFDNSRQHGSSRRALVHSDEHRSMAKSKSWCAAPGPY
jgi:hypothetical protein